MQNHFVIYQVCKAVLYPTVIFSAVFLAVFSLSAKSLDEEFRLEALPELDRVSNTASNYKAQITSLNPLKWQYRVLVTRLEQNEPPSKELLASLQENAPALAERKLRVFLLSADKGYEFDVKAFEAAPTQAQPLLRLQQSMYTTLKTRLSDHHTLLIGLDGTSKESYQELNLKAVYRDIDGMPMRRAELKQ